MIELLQFRNFGSTCFEIYLGDDIQKVIGHEMFLRKSPMFQRKIEAAQAAGRTGARQIIRLPSYDTQAFHQVFSFLYTDALQMNPDSKGKPLVQLKELEELHVVAKAFELTGLQQLIIKQVRTSKIAHRVPVPTFIDWAYNVYFSEIDHDHGLFNRYFHSVAPAMLKGDMEAAKDRNGRTGIEAITDALKYGRGFAVQLFNAQRSVCDLQSFDNSMQLTAYRR